jgi:uncharacterized protein HemY
VDSEDPDPEEVEAGVQLARQAREQEPGNPEFADTLGWALVKQGLAADAVPHLRFAAEHAEQPEHIAVCLYHLALAYERLGRLADAEDAVRAALATSHEFARREEAEALLKRLP